MAGREDVRAQILGGLQQILKFDGLIAGHARDRRFARNITVGKTIHDRFLEPAFIVQHIMRYADLFSSTPCVMNVLASAAGFGAADCSSMIIELKGDADDVIALLLHQRCYD